MSSLVHLGRAAMYRAQLAVPREREAARGTLVPAQEPGRRAGTAGDVMTRCPATAHQNASMPTVWDRLHGTRFAGLAADGGRDDPGRGSTAGPTGRG